MGRAARNVRGKVILYADNVTGSMKRAMDIVEKEEKSRWIIIGSMAFRRKELKRNKKILMKKYYFNRYARPRELQRFQKRFKRSYKKGAGQWSLDDKRRRGKNTSERAVKMAEEYKEGVYVAVGLHPSHLIEQDVE